MYLLAEFHPSVTFENRATRTTLSCRWELKKPRVLIPRLFPGGLECAMFELFSDKILLLRGRKFASKFGAQVQVPHLVEQEQVQPRQVVEHAPGRPLGHR